MSIMQIDCQRFDSGEIEKHYFVSLSIEGLIVNGMTGAG